MQYENTKCRNCRNFKQYYTKENCCFAAQGCGYCSVLRGLTDGKSEACANWRQNHTRRRIRKTLSVKKLRALVKQLEEIRQILDDECEESETNPIHW